jgi:hypothetical protein
MDLRLRCEELGALRIPNTSLKVKPDVVGSGGATSIVCEILQNTCFVGSEGREAT